MGEKTIDAKVLPTKRSMRQGRSPDGEDGPSRRCKASLGTIVSARILMHSMVLLAIGSRILAGCGGIPAIGHSEPRVAWSEGEVELGEIPVDCQLYHGGGLLLPTDLRLTGLFFDIGCEDEAGSDAVGRRRPARAPMVHLASTEGLPEGETLSDLIGRASFVFPIPNEGDSWAVIWGEPFDNWPEYIPSRVWISARDGTGWSQPELLTATKTNSGFLMPSSARHLVIGASGPAMVLTESETAPVVSDAIAGVRLWTPGAGVVDVPFTHRNRSLASAPILAVDRRDHHWLAWADIPEGDGSDPVQPTLRFRLQDIGPGGTNPQPPVWLSDGPAVGDGIDNVTLVFDAENRPHLLWLPEVAGFGPIMHGTRMEPDGAWVWGEVSPVGEGNPGGMIWDLVVAGDVDGKVWVYSTHHHLEMSDGNFGNVHLWSWSNGRWRHHGVSRGSDRLDRTILPILKAAPGPAGIVGTVWTGMTLDLETGSPTQAPTVGIFGHVLVR